VAILISALVVAHAHADDVAPKLLPPTCPRPSRANSFRAKRRLLPRRVIHRYGEMLDWVLERQPRHAVGWRWAPWRLTVLLYIFIPKGFFPVQDTGLIQGISEGPQSISFPAMARAPSRALARAWCWEDPAGGEPVVLHRRGRGSTSTLNSGRMLINLKPLEARDASARSR